MTYAMLYIGGFYHISFALFHLFFPLIFNWPKRLKQLDSVNTAILKIMNFCLIYFFIAIAVISFVFTDALLNSPLGSCILLMIALFWLLRAIEQFLYFPISHPVSVAFFIVFSLGSTLYFVPYFLASG